MFKKHMSLQMTKRALLSQDVINKSRSQENLHLFVIIKKQSRMTYMDVCLLTAYTHSRLFDIFFLDLLKTSL